MKIELANDDGFNGRIPNGKWQLKRNKNGCNLYEWRWKIMSHSNCTTIRSTTAHKTHTQNSYPSNIRELWLWLWRCGRWRRLFFLRVSVCRLALVASSQSDTDIAFSINNGLRNFMTTIMYFALILSNVSLSSNCLPPPSLPLSISIYFSPCSDGCVRACLH